MANLYTTGSVGATFLPQKNIITLFNGVNSGKVLSVYKMWMLNNQTVAVTGVMTIMELWTISATSGGSALTALKHNSNLENLPPQIIITEGATNSYANLFRRFNWSSDEPLASISGMDEWELFANFTSFWKVPINQSIIEPLTLNEGQGVCVRLSTTTSVGQADIFMEFTAT